MQEIWIEDNYDDVISKASRGLGITREEIVDRTHLNVAEVDAVFGGDHSSLRTLTKIATALGLDAHALCSLSQGQSHPVAILPKSVLHFNTSYPVPGYEEMTVNSYAFAPDSPSDIVIAFDTGADAAPLFNEIKNRGRELSVLFLTHTHEDHVAAFPAIQSAGVQTYSSGDEPYKDCTPVAYNDTFEFGAYKLTALSTRGHSPGGISYLLEGLETPVAFVGDSVFCLSMGKAIGKLESAKQEVRDNILSLPPETILCPGHGPLTTVEFELRNNPFFAQSEKGG